MKKTFLALVLVVLLMGVFSFPIAAVDLQPVNDLTTDYENAIENTIEWAKQGESLVFNETLLNSSAVGSTFGDWLAFGVGRYGYADNDQGYLNALEIYVSTKYLNDGGLDSNKATEWHHVTLAVLALGGDPTAFGEDASGDPINLIADGVYDCAVGNLWKQGINGAIWGLIVLDTNQYETPEGASFDRETIIDYILSQEISGGGFALTGTIPDPDITAMALQSLAPYYDSDADVTAAVDRGLTVLSNLQKDDGDYDSWGTVNAESTAQVLVAVCALGIDPLTDNRFIKDGNTLIDGLARYYNAADGGFAHVLTEGEDISSNAMATDQCRYALIAFDRFKDGQSSLYDFYESTVSLRIEGIADTVLYEKNILLDEEETVGDLVERILTEKAILYEKNDVYGYFTSINGEAEGTFGVNYDGWQYRVDGISPMVGMFDYDLTGGEVIELYYGPMDIAYPLLEIEANTDGSNQITVTYESVDWVQSPPVTDTLPIAGATVTIDGEEYLTDENGQFTFCLPKGDYEIAIAKTDATQVVDGKELPLLVRLAPDATITVANSPIDKMTDAKAGAWYYGDVDWMMAEGIMKGDSASTFGVGKTIKRCDFVTVLGRYEGIEDSNSANPAASDFIDVVETAYYASHVSWAVENQIVFGYGNKFGPKDDITRQDMAVIIARYAENAGIDLPAGSGSTAFADDAKIANYAKAAVYSMREAGIISGKGNNKFDPIGTAKREEVAKIIHYLLNLK